MTREGDDWRVYHRDGTLLAIQKQGCLYLEQTHWPYSNRTTDETGDVDYTDLVNAFDHMMWSKVGAPPAPIGLDPAIADLGTTPVVAAPILPGGPSQLVPQVLAPVEPGERERFITDGNPSAEAAPLTGLEQIKLAAARAAIDVFLERMPSDAPLLVAEPLATRIVAMWRERAEAAERPFSTVLWLTHPRSAPAPLARPRRRGWPGSRRASEELGSFAPPGPGASGGVRHPVVRHRRKA